MNNSLSNPLDTFLDTVLAEVDAPNRYVFCALNESPSSDKPWPPIDEVRLNTRLNASPNTLAAYISTMISTTGRNRKSDFFALNMVVLDDVGTKATAPPAAAVPTYRIESSPGNEQWGYVLKQPLRDVNRAERLVAAIYATEHTDSGGRLVNKFVRLPAGINGKERETGRDTHPVTLKELNPDVLYTPEELLEAFDIPADVLDRPIPNQSRHTPSDSPADRAQLDDYGRVHIQTDKVLSWLKAKGHVVNDDGGEWVDVTCPWAHLHSQGTGLVSGYSPLGRGTSNEHRGWNCLHDHCSAKKTVDFLEWVEESGGPQAPVFDPIGLLSARYVLLEYSSEVADIASTAQTVYPIFSLAAFRAAHRQTLPGPRGGKQYYAELWLESEDTLRCTGRVYRPGESALIQKTTNSELLFNTYLPPHHTPMVSPSPATLRPYIEHVDWLIPAEDERELFHDWVARKLQYPASRSYALVMVADLKIGDDGHRYGTGRSTLGDILGRVFQSGIAKIDLADVTGKGDSQTAYNDWVDGTLLGIVEETKDEAGSWRADYASYEGLKKVIDTRPIPGVRIKPKYGKIYTSTLYANFLFFTNHSDAFQLPKDDRRIAVIENAKGRRTLAEYGELKRFLDDDNAIAALYHWYMQRDISNFEHVYPPMTPAKQRMIQQSTHALDEVWELGLAMLPGAVATKRQLLAACNLAADGDDDLLLKIPAMVRARWQKMSQPDFFHTSNGQLTVAQNVKVTAKQVGDVKHLIEAVVARGQTAVMVEEVRKNEEATATL